MIGWPAGGPHQTLGSVIASVKAADWSNNIDGTMTTIDGISMSRPSVGARLRLRVGAGCTRLSIFGASTVYQPPYPTFASPGITIDGVWTQALPVVTNNAYSCYQVKLDGNSHIVEIIEPYQEVHTSIADIYATCIGAISSYGGPISILPQCPASKRMVIYGDSVACGSLAVPHTRNGWPFLLHDLYAGQIRQWTHGGWKIIDDDGGRGFPSYAALAAKLAEGVVGAATQQVWVEIGYNDSVADLASHYGPLLDAITAALPAAVIFAQSPFLTGDEVTAAQKRAAIAAVCTGRANVRYINGLTLMSDPAGVADAIGHLNNVGSALAATAIAAVVA